MHLERDERDAIDILTDAMRDDRLGKADQIAAAAGLLQFSATAAVQDQLERIADHLTDKPAPKVP